MQRNKNMNNKRCFAKNIRFNAHALIRYNTYFSVCIECWLLIVTRTENWDLFEKVN